MTRESILIVLLMLLRKFRKKIIIFEGQFIKAASEVIENKPHPIMLRLQAINKDKYKQILK